MSAYLNLFSLLLGLIAWALPIILLAKPRFAHENIRVLLMLTSFCCCIAALCLQLFEVYHRVTIQDWSALMDIYPANAWVAVILGAFTVLLNLAAWWRFRIYQHKADAAVSRVK